MRFKNSTKFADYFLRRMVRWIMKRNDVRRDRLVAATFRTRRSGCSGHAHARQITCSIGRNPFKPYKWDHYRRAAADPTDGSYLVIGDAFEEIVAITAHEIGHVAHYARGHHWGRDSEARAEAMTRGTVREFRERREELLADWDRPFSRTIKLVADEPAERLAATSVGTEIPADVAAETPADTVKPAEISRRPRIDRTAEKLDKARADLARWQRKEKLAKTKLRKYAKRVAILEKRISRK